MAILPTTGYIVFYRLDKRQGYIRHPPTREEFFFRTGQGRPELQRGTYVQYKLVLTRHGYEAVDIRVINAANPAMGL